MIRVWEQVLLYKQGLGRQVLLYNHWSIILDSENFCMNQLMLNYVLFCFYRVDIFDFQLSEWFLFNTKLAIFHLSYYHKELVMDDAYFVIDKHGNLDFYRFGSLKQHISHHSLVVFRWDDKTEEKININICSWWQTQSDDNFFCANVITMTSKKW